MVLFKSLHMEIKYKINKSYSNIEDWILDLGKSFDNQGDFIINSRNQVKLIEYNNQKFVVKYFKRISGINRYVYRYLRKSKGERAYQYANIMIDKGIETPAPVAFLDVYKGLTIEKSFFVSKFIDYNSVSDLPEVCDPKTEKILSELAKFLHKVHKKGIFHKDLNVGNIMYKIENEEVKFALIDNNRMKFVKYTDRRAMRNMRRLNMPLINYAIFMREYANISNQSEYKTMGLSVFYKNMHTLYRNRKKRIKNKAKSLVLFW